MTMIFFLKILCDAALYYMFAAPLAGYFGSGSLMLCMILQCVIYSISRIPRSRWLRFLLLLPLAVCYLTCRDSIAGAIAISPIIIYILWQSLTDRPGPEHSHQRELLKGCWKPLCLAVAEAFCVSQLTTLLVFGITWLLISVVLLRTLRHTPEVYNQPKFQILNLITVAAVPVSALLLCSQPTINALKVVFVPLYRKILLPLMVTIAWLPMILLQFLIDLLIPNSVQDQVRKKPLELGFGKQQLQATEDYTVPHWIKILFGACLALIACVVIVLLLRRLNRVNGSVDIRKQAQQTNYHFAEPQYHASDNSSTTVRQIRRQYRNFLKLCAKKGIRRTQSSTSQDIDTMARKLSVFLPESHEIRELYIQARYAERANLQSTRQMNSLIKNIKKNMRE